MRIACLFICSALCIFLSGCWDRTEVNDLALVLGMAVDKNETGTIEFSVQVFVPKSSQGGTQGGGSSGSANGNSNTRSATGVTLSNAVSNLREKYSRLTFFAHTKILVIGENAAKDGISDLVDPILRNTEGRVRLKVFISKGNARRTLELLSPLERSTGEVLSEMTTLHSVMDTPIKKLAQMLAGNANAAAIPWIEILRPEKDEKSNKTEPYITGTAIIRNDRMVGQIDASTTKGLLWLRNEMKQPVRITVAPKKAKGYATLYVIKSKSELIPHIENDQWSIRVKVHTKARLIENTTNLSFKNPEFAKALEKDLNKTIESRMKTVLAQVQKGMHADIFGFSEAFHRKYPKSWEQKKDQWNEIFPKIKVDMQVDSALISPGIADTGISRPEKEVKKK